MVFDDGSSFIGYSASRVVDPVTGRQECAPENVTRTYDQIKRFSQRDADAYLRLLDQYDRYWKPAFGTHRFTTPPPYGTSDAMEALCSIPDSGMEPVQGGDLPRRLVGTHVRAHLVRHVVGSEPRARRQARHRRRGVRRADPPRRQESMARHREALQPATHRALVALRAEHDARQRDRDALVRPARHLQRASRHDGRRAGRELRSGRQARRRPQTRSAHGWRPDRSSRSLLHRL